MKRHNPRSSSRFSPPRKWAREPAWVCLPFMGLSSREFFESLEDGQQYLSCFTTEEAYAKIPREVQREMVINEIRQTNASFKDDPYHKALKDKQRKAKNELRDYEFIKNNLNKK